MNSARHIEYRYRYDCMYNSIGFGRPAQSVVSGSKTAGIFDQNDAGVGPLMMRVSVHTDL